MTIPADLEREMDDAVRLAWSKLRNPTVTDLCRAAIAVIGPMVAKRCAEIARNNDNYGSCGGIKHDIAREIESAFPPSDGNSALTDHPESK